MYRVHHICVECHHESIHDKYALHKVIFVYVSVRIQSLLSQRWQAGDVLYKRRLLYYTESAGLSDVLGEGDRAISIWDWSSCTRAGWACRSCWILACTFSSSLFSLRISSFLPSRSINGYTGSGELGACYHASKSKLTSLTLGSSMFFHTSSGSSYLNQLSTCVPIFYFF